MKFLIFAVIVIVAIALGGIAIPHSFSQTAISIGEQLEQARQNIQPAKIVVDSNSSPLKQIKQGISSSDVRCKEGLMLVTKAHNNSPACVKPLTYNKLVERGWASLQGNTYTFYVFANDIKYEIPYHVTGWRNKVLNMTVDTEANSFLVAIQTKNSGGLTVTFPKLFLDSTMKDIDGFFVLVNGEEATYEEKIGESDRTLSIKFPTDTKVIEIIGIKLV